MKYFLDTEFLEGSQKLHTDKWLRFFGIMLLIPALLFAAFLPFTLFKVVVVAIFFLPSIFLFGISIPKTPPTIDLISIGIVSELGQTFYAISKEFNLHEAWNRFDIVKEQVSGDARNQCPEGKTEKVYWIREIVLKPIWSQMFLWQHIEDANLTKEEANEYEKALNAGEYDFLFNLKSFKSLLNQYGKSNKDIASGIFEFVNPDLGFHISAYNNSDLKEGGSLDKHFKIHNVTDIEEIYVAQPEFYAYFADYDWVALCWLFGEMMDLPKGFPMYCRDLKQMLDDYVLEQMEMYRDKVLHPETKEYPSFDSYLKYIKGHPDYPTQENEHHALADAKWNLKLYQFLTRNWFK